MNVAKELHDIWSNGALQTDPIISIRAVIFFPKVEFIGLSKVDVVTLAVYVLSNKTTNLQFLL